MNQKHEEPIGFDQLWKLWLPYARKTDGRGKARPTYLKWLEAGADPKDMIDGAQWHLRSLSERDRPYINLLSVYLNSERWADECEQERAFQKRKADQQTNVVNINRSQPVTRSKFGLEWDRQRAAKQAAE